MSISSAEKKRLLKTTMEMQHKEAAFPLAALAIAALTLPDIIRHGSNAVSAAATGRYGQALRSTGAAAINGGLAFVPGGKAIAGLKGLSKIKGVSTAANTASKIYNATRVANPGKLGKLWNGAHGLTTSMAAYSALGSGAEALGRVPAAKPVSFLQGLGRLFNGASSGSAPTKHASKLYSWEKYPKLARKNIT